MGRCSDRTDPLKRIKTIKDHQADEVADEARAMVASCNNILHKLLPGRLLVDVISNDRIGQSMHLLLHSCHKDISNIPAGIIVQRYHFLTLNNCSKDRENERADNDPPELHVFPILDEQRANNWPTAKKRYTVSQTSDSNLTFRCIFHGVGSDRGPKTLVDGDLLRGRLPVP
ncbi:V-type proton ATPase subunit d [Trichinella spiralis]|uniref:V-type proton ATPase subunit d n=1 Tax=Trichinella spiralis TaxID=6334 RepID=A0ABR3L159_TRISP